MKEVVLFMAVVDEIVKYAEGRKDEFLEILKNVVNYESHIYGERSVKDKCGLYIEGLFKGLGFETWHEDAKEAGTHICGSLGNGNKKIFLLGHYDTVFKTGTTLERPFSIENDKAYGPGIFDMKGGIVVFYMAVKSLIELKQFPDDVEITFFFSCDEEGGSLTSRGLIEKMAAEADVCLCSEPGHKGEGYITIGRYGRDVVKVLAKGVAAHAGNNPQCNPLIEISRQAEYIDKNCRDGDSLYASVVSMHGGDTGATAMTPEEAYLIADIRYKDDEHGKIAAEVIKNIKPAIKDMQIEVSGGVEKPALRQNEKSEFACRRTKEIIEEMGYEYKPTVLGGGSDGNFTSSIGCPTIDGLGLNGQYLHNPREYVDIPTIPQRVALSAELIRTVLNNR